MANNDYCLIGHCCPSVWRLADYTGHCCPSVRRLADYTGHCCPSVPEASRLHRSLLS